MESVTLIRPVVIKVKVTESYKKSLAARIHNSLQQVDGQMRQLEYQAKQIVSKIDKQNIKEVELARQQLEQERQQRLDSRQKLVENLREVGRLSPGDEVLHGRFEGIVEVKVGDGWDKIMGTEIILEEGRVVEIRQAGDGGIESK